MVLRGNGDLKSLESVTGKPNLDKENCILSVILNFNMLYKCLILDICAIQYFLIKSKKKLLKYFLR